jgi:hypothetical protein
MRPPTRQLSRATAATLALFAILGPKSAHGAEGLPKLLADAEAAGSAGRLADAAALYTRAHREFPSDLDAARGACETGLRIAGDATISPSTTEACHKAFLMTQGARDMRNKVGALLHEKPKPAMEAIAIAALMSDAASKAAPDQPWGILARLDIARHLRRADLVEAARRDLSYYAPNFEAVRIALADDRIGRPSIWVWILRILCLLGLVGTGVHAFRHRSKAPSQKSASPASTPAAALLVLLSLLVPARATAAPVEVPDMKDGQLSQFKIDDEHPENAVKALAESNVKNDPLQLGYLLQDLSVKIKHAEVAHDYAAAARFWHAMALAVPTTYAPRKECEALETAGDIAGAVNACREVLVREGSVGSDYARFVDLVLKNPNPLPNLEEKELEGVITHFEEATKGGGNLAAVLRCKVAMRFENRGALQKCKEAMSAAPANDPTVISIKWGLAVRAHDKAGALALVEQARQAGVDGPTVDRMLQTTSTAMQRRNQKMVFLGGLGLLCVAGVFFGARFLASSRRRSATRSPA